MKNYDLQKILQQFPTTDDVRISVDVSGDFVPDEKDPEWNEEDEAGRRVFSDDIVDVFHHGSELTICCVKAEKNY